MKGTADARALDMKRRLAEYQAGREDIRRGEETRRYEEGMGLKREQFDSDVAYRAAKLSADIDAASGLNRRALLTNVSAMIKETNDEILRLQSLGSGPEDPAMMELQSYLNTLKGQSKKYANEIAASLARTDEFDGFAVVGTR
jgi:protein-disulfide isomerase-like protein with CxxC motif